MNSHPSTIDAFADAIKEILEQELHVSPAGEDKEGEIEPAIIIGHSMGGYITLSLAERYPRYVKAFGLFHSTSYADSEEKKLNRQRGIDFINDHGAHIFLRQTIPNLFGERFKQEHGADVEKLMEAAKQFNNESLIGYYRAMMLRPDRSEVLKQSVKPVMLIMGEEDKAVSLADGLQQCAFAEQSLIKILPGVAHMGMWEATEQCNSTIDEFIQLVK